jgi:hypothetical protein
VFFGIGLIIPHSLSLALKPYQSTVGAAGSLFGGSYYILIAGYTAFLSFFHNGTLWPLPIYILVLGMLLLMGSALIQSNAHLAQENQ